MAKVTLKNVCKIYDKNVLAVDNVNLEIRDKEFMVFVGPSGCGKSTTLRMIAGLEEISKGEVKIGDRVVNDVSPKDRDIAMVFQNYALYPHMSVYDNMAFGLKLRKFSKVEIERRVKNAADILGLNEYLERKPKALSGGQRQRVAVGRAIVREPSVFLFDEPLSNLDAKMRVQMRTEISKLHKQLQTTMIYVTHDQIEAMTMGDRICVMKGGLVQQVAEPITLYDNPANKFVASFIGTPPMNFFEGKLEERDNAFYFVASSFELKLPAKYDKESFTTLNSGKLISLGIRPENILLDNEITVDTPEIKSEVVLLEPMGGETYIYLQVDKTQFIAKADSHLVNKESKNLNIGIDMKKIHIFDALSELVI